MANLNLHKAFLGKQGLSTRPVCPRRQRAVAARADRQGLWLPGIGAPKWLDGSLPGDRGFDPLGLATDKERLEWYAVGERVNGMWAMAAVAGILFQELVGVKPVWWAAGAKEYPLSLQTLTALEFLLLGAFELRRYQGWKATKQMGVLNQFPFDPAGLNSEQNAVKEIKNGRLAMVAFVGFAVQALVTRQGPLENLTAHLSDPLNNNFITSIQRLPQTLGQGGDVGGTMAQARELTTK